MARWLVTQGDRQFAAEDLSQLKTLAQQGKIGPGDMVQPPGASDWLYATEIPELVNLLRDDIHAPQGDLDEFDPPRRGPSIGLIVGIFVIVAVIGGLGMWHFGQGLRDADYDLLGRDGLALTEMLVTAPTVSVRAEPQDGASGVGSVSKDAKVQLVAKRGSWYEVQTESGAKGWVKVNEVVPAYFFADEDTRQDYDPIYNPDRYLFVMNSEWKQLPNEDKDNVTIFNFLLQNKSKFEMTDLVLRATIKDKNDHVLETKEIPIEGSVPPYANAWVGTLMPPDDAKEGTVPSRMMTDMLFKQLSKDDQDMLLRWAEGIEVPMQSEGFVEANIDLIQIRAVPRKL